MHYVEHSRKLHNAIKAQDKVLQIRFIYCPLQWKYSYNLYH